MSTYLVALKDVLVVLAPVVVAYISYRSSKKTQGDIKLEVERITKEKEAETKQILDKIGAELESQKQLMTWENSIPQTNEYSNQIGAKRFGNVSALPKLNQDIISILNLNPPVETVVDLNKMLDRLELPNESDELFPHEVPILFNYKLMRNAVNAYLRNKTPEKDQKEEASCIGA